jgi:hypothetical protein
MLFRLNQFKDVLCWRLKIRKKLVLIALSMLLIIGIAGTFWGPSIALAATSIWNSCPKGKVNDAYPGDCRDYIDTNNDRVCDRSQSAPQATASATTTTSSALVNSSVTSGTTGGTASASTGSLIAGDTSIVAETDNAAAPGNSSSYYLIPILAGLIAAYGLTWILSAKKVFKTLTHRKIWNVILLVACLVSALLGIVLTLNLDFDTNITLPFNMLFWHVEAGIALSVIAIFHVVWHWRYFAKMLKMANQSG